MSVTSCDIIHAVGDEDRDGYRIYTVKYKLVTNAKTDGPATVLSYSGLPGVGDTYTNGTESDTSAVFDGKTPSLAEPGPDGSWKIWEVDVRFTNRPADNSTRDPSEPPGDPLLEPWVIELYSAKGRRAVMYGYIASDTGPRLKVIASSAGEPYDPVQEIDDTRYMLRMSHNQDSVNIPLWATYRDAINSDNYFGLPPFTVKIETPGAIRKLYRATDDLPYYNVTWELAVNMDTWRLKLYDYGMYKLIGDELEQLSDLKGVPLTSPRLLDGNGGVLPVGDDPVQLPELSVYKELPFGALGLPASF